MDHHVPGYHHFCTHHTMNPRVPTNKQIPPFARSVRTIRNCDVLQGRKLGQGSYGAVYEGRWEHRRVAIKRMLPVLPELLNMQTYQFWSEYTKLSRIHHPNIIEFYGVIVDDPTGRLAGVIEFMTQGSLMKLLQTRSLCRHEMLGIARNAAAGISHLHSMGIVHFDLKSDNLILTSDIHGNICCKICDLGQSVSFQELNDPRHPRGALAWSAPEIINHQHLTEKVDVYSFGVVMWEMVTRLMPYSNMDPRAVMNAIRNNHILKIPPNVRCYQDWRDLMKRCWRPQQNRPSCMEVAHALHFMQ